MRCGVALWAAEVCIDGRGELIDYLDHYFKLLQKVHSAVVCLIPVPGRVDGGLCSQGLYSVVVMTCHLICT